MAFFDDLLSGTLSDSTTSALIKGGATIGSALLTSNANSNAASTANSGLTSAANIIANSNTDAMNKYIDYGTQGRDALYGARDKGLAAIDTGTQQYTNTINPLLTPTPILLPTYRGLTTQQQLGENDLLRNAQASLAASGLRGAGRAGVSSLLDSDRKYQEDARGTNDTDTRTEERRAQGVSNNARSNLAQVQASAGGSKANVETNTGSQVNSNLTNVGNTLASLTSSSGQTIGNAVSQAAQNTANSDTATAKTDASTLGTLGSIIASANSGSGTVGSKPTALAGSDPYADGGAQKGSV